MESLGFGIARRWRAAEQIKVKRPMIHAFTQHVDDAAFANLSGEAREKL